MSNFQTAFLLKELRKKNDYKIQDIATLLGVSKAAVSKWENGDDIKTENLYELSKLYNVSFSELYYGKLNNEDNSDFWRRNYNLSNYEITEEMINKNIEKVKVFFDQCKMVKERFFDLLPLWAKDELDNNEQEEFLFIKQYFKYDYQFYSIEEFGTELRFGISDQREKEFVRKYVSEIENLDDESYNWEITKLYDFNYDVKSNLICKSGNLKALEYMLSSYSQVEKDSILLLNLKIEEEKEEMGLYGLKTTKIKRERTTNEIECARFLKVMIDAGAHCVYEYKGFYSQWDQEMFDAIEGKISEVDNTIYHKYHFSNFAGHKLCPILDDWKSFSYQDYLNFINNDKTEKIKDIFELRESNPQKYFENMIKRGF